MDSAQVDVQNGVQGKPPNAGFDYTALPDAATHIRLIQVRKAEPGPLQCKMTTWPIASAPAYCAISYTWGDPTSTETISLNDQLIAVRTNGAYALRQAYWHDRDQYIWIDTLCINQDDNAEKSIQVGMMGEIFANAEIVLACVGPHADDSEYFMRMLHQNERLHSSLPTIDITWTPTSDMWDAALTGPVCLWMLRRFLCNFTRYRRAHNAFLQRPYFTRLWVVQELFMAKSIVVCCGDNRTSFERLADQMWMAKLFDDARRREYAASRPKLSFLTMFARLAKFRPVDHFVLRSAIVVAGARRVKEVVSMYQNLSSLDGLECEDPRDFVYGTISLVDWKGQPGIQPDYSKSRLQLAVDVLEKSASEGRSSDSTTLLDWLSIHLKLDQQLDEAKGRVAFILPHASHASDHAREESHTCYLFHVDGLRLIKSDTGSPLCAPCLTTDMGETFWNPVWSSVEMQEGDYVLFGAMGIYQTLIIAREERAGRFGLVGYAAFEQQFGYVRVTGAHFNLYLDPEDMLMLFLLHNADSSRSNEEKNVEMQSRPVCRYPGSSYARKRLQGENDSYYKNGPKDESNGFDSAMHS